MLRAYLFLAFFIPFTGLVAMSAICATLFDRSGRWMHRHGRFWARGGLAVGGVSYEVTGAEQVPATGPVIFMSNHQGNFDILTLYRAVPRPFAWLAKEELFKIPIFGHSMTRGGYIPVNRGDGRKALKSLDAAAALIRGGRSVLIFPEGTRSTDGSLLPFKRGGFILAAKAGVPVVPIALTGSLAINPPRQMRLQPGTIRVKFGTPIPTANCTSAALQEQVHSAIAALLEEPCSVPFS
jgi:1-acyl-sn-glycerol-3-phosphate acyltransferase